MNGHLATRTHEKMSEVLMNPLAPGPEVHYYMLSGEGKRSNITIWEPGTVGGEYIKTYGHYHVGDLHDTYTVLSGSGMVLIQKRFGDTDDVMEHFKAVTVVAGDILEMPAGYAHVIVNTGNIFLVTADDPHGNGHADYLPVQRMQGFAYYLVEHNGAPSLMKNARYREVQKSDLGGLSVIE